MITVSCGMMTVFFAGGFLFFFRRRPVVSIVAMIGAASWATAGVAMYEREFQLEPQLAAQERSIQWQQENMKKIQRGEVKNPFGE